MQTFVLNDELRDELHGWDQEQLKKVIFLEPHPSYPTHYLVNSFDPLFIHDLKEQIGEFRAVNFLKLNQFSEFAEEQGYDYIIFTQDPKPHYDKLNSLNNPYPHDLSVTLKKFQLQGFNYVKDLNSSIMDWSTGTGKSVLGVALAKHLLLTGAIDKVVVASRSHNKINWQRQFLDIGDLEATIPDSIKSSTEERRADRLMTYLEAQIIIVNYEKFRFRGKHTPDMRTPAGDGEELLRALKKKRVLFIWDEMPTKLKKPSTLAHKGARKIKNSTKIAYQIMLTATPVENQPEDVYYCTKILDPSIFSTVDEFRNRYARSFSPFARWQVDKWDLAKLQEMGMKLAHITHTANKYRDPEIAAEFPEEHWEDIIIDMSEQDFKIYQAVVKHIEDEFLLNRRTQTLPLRLCLQTICNNSAWLKLLDSELARRIVERYNPTDAYSAKLETLKEMLNQIEGKVVLFSSFNLLGAQQLSDYIAKWDHAFVLYDGKEKQKQAAQDKFKTDPKIKILISSDQGSDSINLEQATTVINYDLPEKYSTLEQRVNRINRITSKADHVWYYNLICANTMEERKKKRLDEKKAILEAVRAKSLEEAEIYSQLDLSEDDLWYYLLGER